MNALAPTAAQIVAKMTDQEKVDLVSGDGLWKTCAIERLGIPAITMTDGTYGVRYSIEQIDQDIKDEDALAAFLDVVNQRTGLLSEFGRSKPATCFPNGSSVGCSWNVDLAYRMGTALAVECQLLGIHVLLGPGINIRRTPLAGRGYEYYAEDPILMSDLASALIRGLQDHGVGAALKHFACNNSEVQRNTMDSVVEMRALREIYLLGFERTIRMSDPWSVMSSYNLLNGLQTAEHPWLLTTVLREEWGYSGTVMSDWHGIKNRPASLMAGNDLDMPESKARKAELMAALQDGYVSPEAIDRACARIIELVNRAKRGERRDGDCDFEAHHNLARDVAAESIVLLKNENDLLPLDRTRPMRIAVIGKGAVAPVIQGSGCATTNPTFVDIPLNEIRELAAPSITLTYAQGYDQAGFDPGDNRAAAVVTAPHESQSPAERRDGLIEEAVMAAAEADVALVFVSTDVTSDGESEDRANLSLAEGHDELIRRVAAVNRRTIVVLANPDAIAMPWLDQVPVVIETFFAGAGMGNAVANILFGLVNPSGKLSVTFPRRLEDTPAFLTYPGELSRHVYGEGIFVGYRYYDRKAVEPLFPFGFGLSYTSYRYSNLRLDRTMIGNEDDLAVTIDITNIGERAGQEICQVYVRPTSPRLLRPVRELKGYAKVALEPGETRTVAITIASRDLKYFDPDRNAWLLDRDDLVVEVGASSRDIRLETLVSCDTNSTYYARLASATPATVVFQHPTAQARFLAYFRERLGLEVAEAEQLLTNCAKSFFGMYDTICWFIGNRVERADIEEVLKVVNRDSGIE